MTALCFLLAPLLVAEQVHNNAQIAVSVDRVAATATRPSLVEPIKTTQTTDPATQTTSVSAAPVAGNPVNGQNAKASVKSTRHHMKKNISTALKSTGGVLAFIALLPLFVVEWLLAIITCRDDC